MLEEDTFGYANVTILRLLNHLENNNATLTADDLELNCMHLSTTWDPEEPIENLWV